MKPIKLNQIISYKHLVNCLLLFACTQAYSQRVSDIVIPYVKGDKTGIANKLTGEILVEPEYDRVTRLPGGHMLLVSGALNGLLPGRQTLSDTIKIIPPIYNRVQSMCNGWTFVATTPSGNKGLYSTSGAKLLDTTYADFEDLLCYTYVIHNNGNTGLYDPYKGEFLVFGNYELKMFNPVRQLSPPALLNINNYGYVFVDKTNDRFYTDKEGNLHKLPSDIQTEEYLFEFPEDMDMMISSSPHKQTPFLLPETECQINTEVYKSGNWTIKDVGGCIHGLQQIQNVQSGQYGLIRKSTDEIVIAPIYSEILHFDVKGLLIFQVRSTPGYRIFIRDSTNKFTSFDWFDEVDFHLDDMHAIVKQDRLHGLIVFSNNHPPVYFQPAYRRIYADNSYYYHPDRFRAWKVMDQSGNSYYIGSNGKVFYEE